MSKITQKYFKCKECEFKILSTDSNCDILMVKHFIDKGHTGYITIKEDNSTPPQKEIRMLSLEEFEKHLEESGGKIVNEEEFRKDLESLEEEKHKKDKEDD